MWYNGKTKTGCEPMAEKNKPNPQKKRSIVLNFGNQVFKNFFANTGLYLVLNTALVFAITGYTDRWILYDATWTVLFFIGIFTAIEILARHVIYKLFPAIMLYSFGAMGFFITISAMYIADLLLEDFTFRNSTTLTLFIVIFALSRFAIYSILLRNRIRNILDKHHKTPKS